MYSAKVPVNLGRRSYEILIGCGNTERFGATLAEHLPARRAAVVTNERVWSLHGRALAKSMSGAGIEHIVVHIPDGERGKSLSVAEEVYARLIEGQFERGESVIAFGGGVVGDLAGFVAATYLRGVPLVHVPTTLLAQIDSSIGGKVAVNHSKGKNLIGMFYQPIFVFSDVAVLSTLDFENVRNGLAEAIKYGFIWKNGPLSYIEEHLDELLAADSEAIAPLVKECSAIKARIVEVDERDRGVRAVLNYGHTFGHAVETVSHYAYSHGEAVSIGMVFAARLAERLGLVDEKVVERHIEMLERTGLPTSAGRLGVEPLVRAMAVDKKREAGENLFVLLEEVGRAEVRAVPASVIAELAAEMTGAKR